MNHRTERLDALILKELSVIILKEIELDNALITLTDVSITSDLREAKIKFSVLPSENSEKVLKTLRKESGRLKYALQKKIIIRVIPELMFEIDRGPELAANIEKCLLEEDLKEN